MTPGRNRVEVRPVQHNFGDENRAQAKRRAMPPTEQHYLVFETASGFCGIAWTTAGITRFQLPAKSAEAANRQLRRRLPHAQPGTPPADVARAVSAARRYFAGEQTDFADLKLDLGTQTDFSTGSMPRRDGFNGATQPPTARWQRSWAPGRRPPAMSARPWPITRYPSSSPATGCWPRAVSSAAFPHRAV